MNRRNFLQLTGAAAFTALYNRPAWGALVQQGNVRQVTAAPGNHFFGYYGINPWNAANTHLLCLEAPFNHRLPVAGEKAAIGLVEMKTGKFRKITETHAWNMQQGCMLHWNPHKADDQFYFNDNVNGKLVSVLYDLKQGKRIGATDTISGLAHNGHHALYMNYGRISRLRKVVSYGGAKDKNMDTPHPGNDGVFVTDLRTGKKKLIVSYKKIASDILTYAPEIRNSHMWIEHAAFNPSSSRFLFLPRTWNTDGSKLETGLYTIGIDGEDMRRVIPYGSSVSHFGWRNDEEIAATYAFGGKERCHVLFADKADGGNSYQKLEPLNWDGHCSFNADGSWLLTDGGKDFEKISNSVWLYNMAGGKEIKLATMPMLEARFLKGDARCDLHPRWRNDSKMVCIDAIDIKTKTRQLFTIETGI